MVYSEPSAGRHDVHPSRRRRGLASPSGILLVAACIQNSSRSVHAYAPSLSVSRLNYRGSLHEYQRCRPGSMPLPRTSAQSQSGDWCEELNVRRNTRLFAANSGSDSEGASNDETVTTIDSLNEDATINVQETSSKIDGDAAFDNLLPSTMASAGNRRMGMVGRGKKATGLSASVLLPLSESEKNVPLFQTINQPTEYSAPANEATWKERLVDVSNLASLLCVLDCTLLPLVSVAIPLLSWGVGFVTGASSAAAVTSSNPIMAGLSSFLAYLPTLSHGIALYFVIPVGLLTTIVNYFFGHREAKFSIVSFVGVALIFAANSSSGVGIPSVDAWLASTGIAAGHVHHGGHVHDTCGAVVGAATNMMAHTCPEGLAHRLTNTMGCAFLLGSNYYSRKYMEEKSQGCAASALAEAWGGDSRGSTVCPPGCNCEAPSYASGGSRMGGETFFQWERSPDREKKGGRSITRLHR